MKKFLLLTLLTLPLFTVAQEYQYVPFPDSGAIWSEVFYPAYDEGETIQKIYERFAVTGEDTLMNEMLYKKLYIFYDSVFNKNNATCIGGIREDSLKKVYYKGERIHMFKPLDNEIILYDFSLEIGDTIWLWDMYNVFDWLIVEYIDTIQIGNTLRKKFLFNFWRSKWIEGIGCLSGLLFAGRDDITGLGDFEDNELICFFHNDTLLYHNNRFYDCFPKLSNSKDNEMQPKILFHIAIALLLFISNSMHGQINHKVSFPKNFSINPEELDDGNIYNRIEFNDMLHADSIGYPSLPVKYINLLVPPESEITGLTINHAQGNTINLDYLIEPAQNPKFPVLINLQEDFIGPNKKKYNSNTPYPSASAAIVKENLFRGNKIVTLAVYPFRYFPASNQLEFYASVDFTLNYTGSGENNKQDRVKIDENSLTGKVLKYLIDNKEDIGKYVHCTN